MGKAGKELALGTNVTRDSKMTRALHLSPLLCPSSQLSSFLRTPADGWGGVYHNTAIAVSRRTPTRRYATGKRKKEVSLQLSFERSLIGLASGHVTMAWPNHRGQGD